MVDFETLQAWVPDRQDVGILFLAAVVLWWIRGALKNWNVRLPPGPPSLPLVGSLHQISKNLHLDFERWGKQYGPLIHLRIGSIPVIVVQNAAYAREICKIHDQVFAHRPQDTLSNQLLFAKGQALPLAQPGDHWRNMRKVLATEIFIPKRLRTFKDQRQELLRGAVNEMFEETNQGKEVDMKEHLVSLMYNVVTQMVAGKVLYGTASAVSAEQREFRTMVKDLLLMLSKFAVKDWFPFTRIFGDFQGIESQMKKVHARIDQFLQTLLDDHRKAQEEREERRLRSPLGLKEEEKEDFVDSLLQAQGEEGKPLTDKERKLIMQPLLVAGTDAASTVMLWAMAELNRQPALMKRVQEEIDSVVGRDRLVQEDDLPKLKLLIAVIKETFRLHPGGAFLLPRQGITNCKVGGYDIPSNARIFVSLWGLGRDESAWENALQFRPERFSDSEDPTEFNGSSYKFIPFGAGRRFCPGMNLGLLMAQLGLANLVHLCNFSLPGTKKPEDIDLTAKAEFTLVLETPLKLFASPRLAPEVYRAHTAVVDHN